VEPESHDSGHVPVLLSEVVALLQPERGGILVDATLGLGGHAEALLRSSENVRLIGIDRDPDALVRARARLAPFASRTEFVEGRHEDIAAILDRLGIPRVDGVLADLGVSSLQLDIAERGFSFLRPGPLDMRMSRSGRTAADIVMEATREELETIFWEYGEEPMAAKIARLIVERRKQAPVVTTDGLRSLVHVAAARRPGKTDPATRVFQALRIATNNELTGLERFLDDAIARLSLGSRLTVLAYHSLEDRIVKRTFARHTAVCTCPPSFPACVCARTKVMALVTRKPIRPSEVEVNRNPRSRSARLRAVERAGEA
jgi:16S rRNA (cytosine1402-N4)-methyltransferase